MNNLSYEFLLEWCNSNVQPILEESPEWCPDQAFDTLMDKFIDDFNFSASEYHVALELIRETCRNNFCNEPVGDTILYNLKESFTNSITGRRSLSRVEISIDCPICLTEVLIGTVLIHFYAGGGKQIMQESVVSCPECTAKFNSFMVLDNGIKGTEEKISSAIREMLVIGNSIEKDVERLATQCGESIVSCYISEALINLSSALALLKDYMAAETKPHVHREHC